MQARRSCPWGFKGQRSLKPVWGSDPPSASRDQAVDEQQYDRPQGGYHYRPDVEACCACAPEDADQNAAYHSSCHADESRYDKVARVVSGQQELCQKPGDEADHYPAYDAQPLRSFSL